MTTKIYKVQGMDCDACAKMIELDLEDAGITASCNYAKELLEVELEDQKDESKISEVIEAGGYKLANI